MTGRPAGSDLPIESRIFIINDKKVILDSDLASLYGVETKRLNEQVTRNIERFPVDFCFPLKNHDLVNLRSQIATSSSAKPAHGGRRSVIRAFTEHGAIMAASVLNSPRAIEVSVFVVRAFVSLRDHSLATRELGHKLDELERKVAGHGNAIGSLVKAIRDLTQRPEPRKQRPIGFAPWQED
ncbi:MAG TPA: ORF6N domain-containing protein [Candidatus Acidoferrum sp.]|nr:ORF6N domain-containing protein [Candidatus Acidoferrum sp.]